MGIVFAAVISMLSVQSKEAKSIKQQLASMNTKYFILQTLARSNSCTCQFDDFDIDTTKSPTNDIPLGTFRSGCETSSDDNIIVKEGDPVKGVPSLTVESVKVTNVEKIVGTTGEYKGELTITYANRGLVRAIRPIEIDLIFSVNTAGGDDDTARPIASCWGEEDYSCYIVDEEGSQGRVLVGCGGTSDISAKRTTAFGFKAGVGSSGIDNVFIGYKSGEGLSGSNQFALGNKISPTWLRGDMTSSQLYVNDKEIGLKEYIDEVNQRIDTLTTDINSRIDVIRDNLTAIEEALPHTHSLSNHTHSMGEHSHTVGGHSHGADGGVSGEGSTSPSGGQTGGGTNGAIVTAMNGETLELKPIDPINTEGERPDDVIAEPVDRLPSTVCSPLFSEARAEAVIHFRNQFGRSPNGCRKDCPDASVLRIVGNPQSLTFSYQRRNLGTLECEDATGTVSYCAMICFDGPR